MADETPYKSEGETVDVIDDRADEQDETGKEYDEKYHDPEWLYNQYHGLGKSTPEMAEECGVVDSTIRTWMDRHGIDRRSHSEANISGGPYTDEEWLREQYHGRKRSAAEIAEGCGVNQYAIYRWMDRHGIDTRSRAEANMTDGRYTDEEWLREQYHGHGKTTYEIADECGVHVTTISKWMDKHGIASRSISEAKKRQSDKVVYVSDVESPPTESAPERKTVEVGGRRYEGPVAGLDLTESDIRDRNVEVLESPWRDEEWLREQYHGRKQSATEIAEECGVAKTTIYDWMKNNGIERRSYSEVRMGNGPYTDEEWLREQYHEQERSAYNIADRCGANVDTIYRWMDKHGIDRRSNQKAQNVRFGGDKDGS
jgi:transposase